MHKVTPLCVLFKKVKMNKYYIFAAVWMSVSLSATAKSESEPIDTTKIIELQDVHVVSTRATKKTPVAYTTVTKEQLKSVNHGKDIPSLLTMTPSVTMTSDAGNGIGYTSMMVRGSDNTRVNITANGIPMNDSESSGLYWVNFGDFASSAEDIQIQRGVGTSTNGAGAFGATVNIQTEKIGVKPFIGLDLGAGSYSSHKETIRFGTGLLGGHWGVQGRLSNIGSKGYIDRASTKLNSYFLQAGYFADNTVVKFITFNGQEETYHAWNYASKYEQQLYGRTYNSCGEYYLNDGTVAYYDNQVDNYHSQNYQLILDQHLSNFLKLNAALHYTRGDGYYEEYKVNKNLQEYGLSTYKLKSDLIRRKQMGNDFYGAVASLNFDNKNGINAILGGGWNKYIGDHYGNVLWVKAPYSAAYDKEGNNLLDASGKPVYILSGVEQTPNFEYYRNRAKKTDFNVYGKVNYEFIKGFNAFLDLQYRTVSLKMQNPSDYYTGVKGGDYILSKTYNFFNPKFGLNYDITLNHKVYASVGVGHKEPTRNDWEDNLTNDLKAEQLIDYEAGYKYQSQKFSAGANLYYMDYRNQFVLTGKLNDIGEPIKTNSGKSYRMGIELEAAWQPVDWFNWSANATFSKNRNKDWNVTLCNFVDYSYGETVSLGDTPIIFSPSTLVNNQFTFKYSGFKAAIMSHYVSEQFLTNTGFKGYYNVYGNDEYVSAMLDAHFTTDIDLSYTTKALACCGLKEVTIGATLYNIFSTKYDTNGWSYLEVGKDKNGNYRAWSSDMYETGVAAAAPFNFMVNLSLNF